MVEGETPGGLELGETPGVSVREDVPATTEEQVPEEGLFTEIVDLEDEPEGVEEPLTEREARRRARRNLLDEVEDLTQPGQATDVEQEEETPGAREELGEAEDRRLAAERKRKGKHAAAPQPKRSKRIASIEHVETPLPAPTKVPFAKEPIGPSPGNESELEEEEEPEEVFNFERAEVWVTKQLLENMGRFTDPKRIQTYKERCAPGKMAKSGKRYDPEVLREIGSEEEFLACIRDIGFEWLLNHSAAEVPVALAQEFFSTFRFRPTTDPDADSITFRLFTGEHEMSIREWSLRLGLLTNQEDEERLWDDRMIGPPKDTPGFKPQTAWEFVTHKRVGNFKTSHSRGYHITNHILRFAQVFIGYNLMGTASSSLTTADLYFTWCMAKRIKVHLGYWVAQACHQVTANPSRHMFTCHLLGAYLQRNFIMKIGKATPVVPMCEPAESFSMEYFFNKGLLYMDGPDVCFYEVGKPEAQVKKEVVGVETVSGVEYEELRKEYGELRREIQEMRKEIGGVQREVQAINGSITDLVGKSSVQNDRMTDAVKLMMKMADWLQKTLPQTQPKLPPGPSSVVRQPGLGSSPLQPGQGSSQLQKPQPTSKPKVAQAVSRSQVSVPVKKPMTKQPITEEDVPASPEKKRVKMNRPTVPPRSGSHGGQTQN